MAVEHVLAVDLAKIWRSPDRKKLVTTVGWGDPVRVLDQTDDHLVVRIWDFVRQPDGSERPVPASGYIRPPDHLDKRPDELVVERPLSKVLKVDFVDVQQGDGAVVETPSGHVILVDAGENQLFARYLAGRFRRTTAEKPFMPDAVVITHGDADHFSGLMQIAKSEAHDTKWKRLFLAPRRVFHNGLVKRSEKLADGGNRPEVEQLGATVQVGDDTLITDLVNDPRDVDRAEMNKPFRAWAETLDHWDTRTPTEVRRLVRGSNAFEFLDDGVAIDVLGPIESQEDGIRGLTFLGRPPSGPRMDLESIRGTQRFSGRSASHTINGHSIILRIHYGDVRFLLTGDLNEEASARLRRTGDGRELQAEVFKAPHHGSADFDPELLAAVSPVISVVSSGDESVRTEYIHPRATLVGALGKHSRVREPLVFVTELVAFFEMRGWTSPEFHRLDRQGTAVVRDGQAVTVQRRKKSFFAFNRRAFGIVRVRTDGERLFVYTDSGHNDLKEAYAYTVRDGVVTPSRVMQA